MVCRVNLIVLACSGRFALSKFVAADWFRTYKPLNTLELQRKIWKDDLHNQSLRSPAETTPFPSNLINHGAQKRLKLRTESNECIVVRIH